MNCKKNFNGWVLCPSKRFPGKFYYFNVLNGETAWRRDNMEDTAMQRVGPEPVSPPAREWDFRPQGFLPRNQVSPMFAQAIFPNYPPDVRMSGMMWPSSAPMNSMSNIAHMQMSYPMPQMAFPMTPFATMGLMPGAYNMPLYPQFWPQEPAYPYPTENSAWVDRRRNTSQNVLSNPFETQRIIDYGQRPMLECQPLNNQQLQTIPEHKRMVNLPATRNVVNDTQIMTKPAGNVDGNGNSVMPNPQQTEQNPTKPDLSMLTRGRKISMGNPSSTETSHLKSQINIVPKMPEALKRNPFLTSKRPETHTKNEFGQNPIPTKPKPNQPSTNTLSKTNNNAKKNIIQSTSFEKINVETLLENEAANNRIEEHKSVSKKALPSIDLRFTLLAKRKQKISVNQNEDEGKKIKILDVNKDISESSQKEVTYNDDVAAETKTIKDVGVVERDTVETLKEMNAPDTNQATVSLPFLRKLGSLADGESWYVVLEESVLLSDYDFLVEFFSQDSTCMVVIPDAVRREVEALSHGDQRGRPHTMAARQLVRKLAKPPNNVLFQEPDVEETLVHDSLATSVMDCCHMMMEDHHVILITNDEDLYEMASESKILVFMLREIKDAAEVKNSELSFEIKKIQSDPTEMAFQMKKNQSEPTEVVFQNEIQIETKDNLDDKMATESPTAKIIEGFKVNCFRKRLFDNLSNVCNDPTVINKHPVIQPNKTAASVDGQKILKKSKETVENCNMPLSPGIMDEIENLNLKDDQKRVPTKTVSTQSEENMKNAAKRKGTPPENETVLVPKKVRIQKENVNTFRMTTAVRRIGRINGYTIEAQLKKFRINDESVETRIWSHFEEWVCYFTQIMDDCLTGLLQSGFYTHESSSPPLNLIETIECSAVVFGDGNPAIPILCARLADLLSTPQRKEKFGISSPEDFMKMLGCGILLIKCLNNSLDAPEECLYLAEEALMGLLLTIEQPEDVPLLNEDVNEANELEVERKNFVKDSTEILEYLKKHYPEWKDYNEHPQDYRQENTNKVLRTSGKEISLVTIDHTKSITMKTPDNPNIENQKKDTKDTEVKKVTEETPKDNLVVKHETTPKLLKKLADKSIGKNKSPVLREIDVEKRENVNKEMEDMISNMTKPNITKKYDLNAIIVNEGSQIIPDKDTKETSKANRDEPKIMRRFDVDPFEINKSDAKDNRILEFLDTDAEPMCHFGETKSTNLKIVRNVKPIDDFEKKIAANKEKETTTAIVNEKQTLNRQAESASNVMKSAEEKIFKDMPIDYEALDYAMFKSEPEDVTMDFEDENIQEQNEDNIPLNVMMKNTSEILGNDSNHGDDFGVKDDENMNGIDGTDTQGVMETSAYQKLKMTLAVLGKTLLDMREFVKHNMSKWSRARSGGSRMRIREKVQTEFAKFPSVLEELKCINVRESNPQTAEFAAVLTDPAAADDPMAINYRSVFKRLLEKANVTMERLQMLVSLTEHNANTANTATNTANTATNTANTATNTANTATNTVSVGPNSTADKGNKKKTLKRSKKKSKSENKSKSKNK